MKNACKKLFSLLLVAVLLVSVVPFQALAAETEGADAEPLTDGAQTYTVIVYDENGWKENITVEAGGVVDAKYLSEKYDVEGYKTVWNDGNFVPGESRINSDNFVIGCKYEKLVTKYSVEFYAGEEWIGGIKVGTDGKILDGTVPTAPTKPGMEFTGWFHSAGEYKPGKTKITGDLVVGAQYEETKKPEGDKNPGNRPGDNNDHNGNRPGDKDEAKTFVITFENDDHSIKAYSFDKKTNDLSVSEEPGSVGSGEGQTRRRVQAERQLQKKRIREGQRRQVLRYR